MFEGNNMRIIITLKKPTPERKKGGGEASRGSSRSVAPLFPTACSDTAWNAVRCVPRVRTRCALRLGMTSGGER
jgi:hypothetical protein